MKTYRLGSSEWVKAPGLVAWAVNGGHFKKDVKYLTKVIAECWGVPKEAAKALVTSKVTYTVEGETVVFTA